MPPSEPSKSTSPQTHLGGPDAGAGGEALIGLTLRQTLVLVGMPGSGKSAIGRTLAARLGVPMRDSDAEIEARARRTIAEIFERDGEAFFRDRERLVIASLLKGPPAILSTGGGAWLSEQNRTLISKRAAVLWLRADLELLWNRVKHRDTRPLLRTADPKATLTELFEARQPAYGKAPLAIDVASDWSIEETCDAVQAALIVAGVIARTDTAKGV